MSIFTAPRFLRNVLLADAASCVATGALQVLFTERLAALLHLPAPLLAGTGWFLLAYAGIVVIIAWREPLQRAFVGLLALGNLGWAVGCGALLASGLIAPSALGVAWIVAQAVTVAVLAELQWTGLRRTRGAGFA